MPSEETRSHPDRRHAQAKRGCMRSCEVCDTQRGNLATCYVFILSTPSALQVVGIGAAGISKAAPYFRQPVSHRRSKSPAAFIRDAQSCALSPSTWTRPWASHLRLSTHSHLRKAQCVLRNHAHGTGATRLDELTHCCVVALPRSSG